MILLGRLFFILLSVRTWTLGTEKEEEKDDDDAAEEGVLGGARFSGVKAGILNFIFCIRF